MSVKRGCLGTIKGKVNLATGAVATVDEVRDWTYEESAEQIDASKIGDCTKKFEAGAKQTTGTLNCWWEPAATGNQTIFTVGDKVDLELYPAGPTSGNTYYTTPTGGATITSVSRSGSVDGLVENNFGFTINGEMTTTTVP